MEMRSQDSDIGALFKQGLDQHNSGNLSAAKIIYHEILAIQPDHCEANHNIGIVLVAKNKLDKALEFFKLALTASPNVSLFWASYIDTLAKLERIIEAKALIKAAKSSGIFCENIESVSHRVDIENQEPLAKYTGEIDSFITQKKFDDAIKACLNLLETYPSSAILNVTLGQCYFELGHMELAISSYTKATEYWPQSELSYAMLGQLYSLQGNTAQAIENLKIALELEPNDLGINLLLGVELTQNADFDEAIESYKQALKLKPDYAEAYSNMGIALAGQGKLEEAIAAYSKAILLKSDFPEAYSNMGKALADQGKLEEAIEAYNKAVSLKSDFPEAYTNMGLALADQGKLEEAIAAFNKALSFKPDYAEAYSNMGIALADQGKLEEAIAAYNKAVSLKSDFPEAYSNMGKALADQGKLEEAIAASNKALSFKSDFPEAYSNMGMALRDQGKLEEAVAALNKAVSLKPDYADAYSDMGIALADQGKLEEAIAAYNKAVSLKSDFPEAYSNMGMALADQGKLEEAIEAFNKALSFKPDYAGAYNNMGLALADQGKLEEAIAAFSKAVSLESDFPSAYSNMGLALLATRNFSKGFELQEWRWKTKERGGQFLQSSKPLWDNEQGKSVFVWGEQGIGDEIMFAAMIPELRKLSSKIILRCDERLIPLFKRSFPGDIIFYSQGQSVAEDEYDFHIPIGSLANVFRTSLESFKKTSAGFLTHDRKKTSRLRDSILAGKEKKVIGISWKTQSLLRVSGNRNIKLADLAQILDHANTRLVCLQYGDVDDEVKALKRDSGIEIIQVSEVDNMNDIDGLASLIMACDQVVSTTNVTVHLAGALGANTKVLLPFSARWIWGCSGSDSFWYDTVSPYRQNKAKDWGDVLRALA